MNKTVFRPFWSYDVQKTERWLAEMAGQGWRLVSIDFFTRVFRFETGDQENSIYRIQYEKPAVDYGSQFAPSGWASVLSRGRWNFLSGANAIGEARVNLSRDGILRRNTNIFVASMTVLIVAVVLLLPMFILPILIFSLLLGGPITSDSGVEPFTTNLFLGSLLAGLALFFLILFVLAVAIALSIFIYSFFKLWSTNKKLRMENNKFPDLSFSIPKDALLNPATERRLMKDKKIFRKWKYGWMYGPDKFDQWLENMELKGFNLYRANRMWTLYYFYIGKPRKIKYYSDYQNRTNEDYYQIHQQEGWRLVFTSPVNFQKFTIWCKEYNEGEPAPQFYPDKTELAKQARKLLVFSWLFGAVTLIWIMAGIMNTSNAFYDYMNFPDDPTSLVLFYISFFLDIFIVLLFGSFAIRPILYYRRIKRKASEL